MAISVGNFSRHYLSVFRWLMVLRREERLLRVVNNNKHTQNPFLKNITM